MYVQRCGAVRFIITIVFTGARRTAGSTEQCECQSRGIARRDVILRVEASSYVTHANRLIIFNICCFHCFPSSTPLPYVGLSAAPAAGRGPGEEG